MFMRWGVKNSLAKIKEPKRSKLFEFAKKLKFMCETADASHGSRHTAHARRHGRTLRSSRSENRTRDPPRAPSRVAGHQFLVRNVHKISLSLHKCTPRNTYTSTLHMLHLYAELASYFTQHATCSRFNAALLLSMRVHPVEKSWGRGVTHMVGPPGPAVRPSGPRQSAGRSRWP